MAIFPTSVATDVQLYVAVNGIQTALAAPALVTDTSLTLVSTTSFPTTGAVTVDNNEVVFYTGVSGNILTGCTRGADGTTPLLHSQGAVVGLTIVAAHHNLLKNEIEAIETALGAGYTRTLENLLDVIVTFPMTGQILQWNGTDWINASSTLGITQLTGDVTSGPGTGSQVATVVSVGGATSTEVGYTHGVTSSIQTQINNIAQAPSGMMGMWFTATAPSGWLLMDGSTYAQAVSPTLYTIFNGVGGFFTLPNLANYAMVGAGTIAALMATAGSQTHTLVDTEMAATAVTVGITDPGHNHSIFNEKGGDNTVVLASDTGSGNPDSIQNGTGGGFAFGIRSNTTGITASGHVNGSATPFSIVQPSYGINFIIKR